MCDALLKLLYDFINRCRCTMRDRSRLYVVVVTLWCMVCANASWTNALSSRRDGPVECIIEPSISSPYVRFHHISATTTSVPPSDERRAHASCARINERHVIELDDESSSSSPFHSGATPIRVSLHVKPTDELSERNIGGTLIFVLASRRPVEWSFIPEFYENDFYIQFWVSNGSHIFGSYRHVHEAPVHKVPAGRLETLTSWVENTLGPVTFYVQIPLVNRSMSHSLNIGFLDQMEYVCPVMPQLVSGCLAISNKGLQNRDLHVIEVVDSSPSDGGQPPEVELMIKPALVRRQRRNLMLVLKSHSSAVWVISTRGLRGTLDVVTEDALNITQIGMESVRVISERLRGLSGQQLVDWTADTYGPLVSYTLIPQTDRLELISDGDDYYRQIPTEMPSPDENLQEDFERTSPERTLKKTIKSNRKEQSSHREAEVSTAKGYVSCGSATIYHSGMSVFLIAGIAFAAFSIGCLLIGVLWFIKTCTVSRRKTNIRECDDVIAKDTSIALTSEATRGTTLIAPTDDDAV